MDVESKTSSIIENRINHSKLMIESFISDDVDGQQNYWKYKVHSHFFQLDEFHILKCFSTSLFPLPHELTIFI